MDERPVHLNGLTGEESAPGEEFPNNLDSPQYMLLNFVDNEPTYGFPMFPSHNGNASFLATEQPGHGMNNIGQLGTSESHDLLTTPVWMYHTTPLQEYVGWQRVPIMEPHTMNVEGVSPDANENAKEGRGRQGWTPDQDRFLLESWKKGRKYTEIAEEMSKKFPEKGKTTPNCLVKRVGKIQNQDWDLLARAVHNSMAKFQEEIESQIDKLKSEHGLSIDNEMHRQIISGLSKQVPALVQKKITVWKKSRSNTSLSRSAVE
ncbi:hypothetical protein QBC37DRAFT_421687 [Rhypophila decipiens]|uniref:Myb-like domain-containing protein n=1 Tax=Rhypophila decipiens TaxID=261697 RepID=A0AAN7B7Z4_9PEZI|nr:hypothetical protein QBC37DRAFT_421687 [Rhypophila decipiens]